MAVRVRVRHLGSERFRRAIGKLKLPEAEPIYRRALRRSVGLISRTTKEDYLSGQVLPVRTGELRRSVGVDLSRLPRQASVGSEHEGAAALHFGWPAKNIGPHPFLFPAVERDLTKLPNLWIEEMDREVSKA